MPNKVLRVICPSCNKTYVTRCGLKKHLLKEHQLAFIANSNHIRSVTDAEFQDAMLKRWKAQQHPERAVTSTLPAQSQQPQRTMKRTMTQTHSNPAVLRVAPTPPGEVRDTHTPPMPTLVPVNNLSAAQIEQEVALPPDTLSIHSGDINLSLLDSTLTGSGDRVSVSPELPPLSPIQIGRAHV